MPGSRPSPGRLTPKLICTRAHPHLDALNSPVDPLPGSLATEGFSISRNLTCALLLALPLPPRNLSPAAHLEPSVLVYPERENRLGGWKGFISGQCANREAPRNSNRPKRPAARAGAHFGVYQSETFSLALGSQLRELIDGRDGEHSFRSSSTGVLYKVGCASARLWPSRRNHAHREVHG